MGSMANALGRLDDEKLEDISKEDVCTMATRGGGKLVLRVHEAVYQQRRVRSILVIIKILKITLKGLRKSVERSKKKGRDTTINIPIGGLVYYPFIINGNRCFF